MIGPIADPVPWPALNLHVLCKRRSMKLVVRRILTVATLMCLATLAVFYPVIEALDRWDAPGPSSDSEIQIIALLTLVGAMFVLARLLVTLVRSFLGSLFLSLSRSALNSGEVTTFRFAPLENASPPLILRI